MLNILLGVGLSGTYLIASNPTREPIHVEMGPTLMVSGVGLFTILIGSLIVVPLNGFRMTKRIGGFLIAAYTVSQLLSSLGSFFSFFFLTPAPWVRCRSCCRSMS